MSFSGFETQLKAWGFAGLFACVAANAAGTVQVAALADLLALYEDFSIAATLTERAEKGDFSPLPAPTDYHAKLRAMSHPIRAFAPDPARRTKENWRKVIEDCRRASLP